MITDREKIMAIVDNDCFTKSDVAVLLEGDGFFRIQKLQHRRPRFLLILKDARKHHAVQRTQPHGRLFCTHHLQHPPL